MLCTNTFETSSTVQSHFYGGLAVAKNKFWYCHVNLSYKQGPVCLSNHFTVIQILSRIILIPVVIKAHQPVLLYKDATREVVGIVFEARP